jgi:hypothetical protein
MLGVRFDDIHTYDDWGLHWLEPYTIDYPEADVRTVDIPGTDGVIDLTEAITGHVRYKNRKFDLQFETLDGDYFRHEMIKLQIAAYLHGKRRKVYLDTDPGYYYDARLTVAVEKTSKTDAIITVTGDADPFKYQIFTAGDDWLWDTFCFETDTIRESKDLLVQGERAVYLAPTQSPVAPKITCSAPMTLKYKDETVSLPAGQFQSPYIVLENEENVLTFTGSGVVTIDYRAGAL